MDPHLKSECPFTGTAGLLGRKCGWKPFTECRHTRLTFRFNFRIINSAGKHVNVMIQCHREI